MPLADRTSARPRNLLEFGAVKDGPPASAAATSAALNAFGVWARAESAAGRAVHVVAPPGIYYFDYAVALNCFKGIVKLVFSGHGAKFLQTHAGGLAWPVSCDTVLYRNTVNPLIAAADKGATRVVAATPSELAQYAPGEMVMIAGLDIQFGGYPPNLYCFDFVRIETVDPATGVMTFDPPLSYDYLPTFPAYPVKNKWGGSRIYKLDRNGFTWDVDHSFLGLDCRNASEAEGSYVLAMGRKLTFRDCTTPGFAESICETFFAERCVERVHTEPDKLVKKTVRRGGDLQAGIGLQSASVDLITVEDCKIKGVAIGGKKLTFRNCDIGQLGFGGFLGFCDEATFENCRIGTAQYCYPYMPGSRLNYVDGVNITYANGVFTVLKNDAYGLPSGGGLANWNVMPGQVLQFCRGTPGDSGHNGSHIASDLGTGFVVSVEDRPGAIAIMTTLTAAEVPAWSSGQVFVKRRNASVFRNCTGAEPARLGSEASKAGKNFGEYFRYLFTGRNIVQGQSLEGRTGRLVRFCANVIRPIAGLKDAKLTVSELAAYKASTMESPLHYYIDIDLTIAGRRDFTVQSLRGAVGSDRVSYNGQAQAGLPFDVWCEGGMPSLFCNGAPFAKDLADQPVFELIFEFDMGLLAEHTTLHQRPR
jgi:hypothetical protein